MKITFDNMPQVNQNSETVHRSVRTAASAKAYAYNVAFDGKERVGFGTEAASKAKSSVPQVVDSADAQVQNMRNQLTVMSHTMSDEDFAKLKEEGYDPSEMDPQEAVTILDKIKAELMKAGEHIAGYTDDVDMTTLAAAVGSEALAAALTESFAGKDIPMEKQNIERAVWALEVAAKLSVPTENSYYYMAANEMSATLLDFYMASASGARRELEQGSEYFGEAVKGYVTKNVSFADNGSETMNMEQEVAKLLERLGVEAGEEELTAVTWLVERGLPADAEAIGRMKDILSVQFPLEEKQVLDTVAAAIADGIPVGEKNLADTATYVEKAIAIYEEYQGEGALNKVQDRRQLEEIRLRMTVEANVKLLKSGFSIETAPIEQTIEALKKVEQELAKQYFPQAQNPEAKYQLLKETGTVLKELPGMPASTVGVWAERLQEGTLSELYTEGKLLANAYKAAGERYETIGTAPRADMGDSIQKAFANVDDILGDLNYEASEENRKLIRILGYNHMEMSRENVERVRVAQESVESVIRQMTPAATLKMIRDDVNPLEATLPELQKYFEELPQEYSQTAEKYSQFLYQLEKSGNITQEERDSFIGCYRLMNQIEKSDGAVVGALINTGGELNFRNLLSAVRTGKFKSMDVRVNDAIGALSEDAVLKLSISEQINAAFSKEEAADCREQQKEAAGAPAEAYRMLERGEQEPSAQNVLAAKLLEQESDSVLTRLLEKSAKKKERLESWKYLDNKEAFTAEYDADVTEVMEQVENATLQEADTTLDIRSMRLMHKQLTIMQSLSTNEEYFIPMEIGGEVTGVHLQFTHSEEESAVVRIRMESVSIGTLSGTLQITSVGLEGYFVGNREETVMNLKQASDIFTSSFGEEWNSCRIEFVYSETNDIPMDWTRRSAGAHVGTDRLYGLSKSFLQLVKDVGDKIGEVKYEN